MAVRMNKQTQQHGFTLIELMITLVIAAILLTMGVPSFSAMIQNNRITAQTNQFVTAMNFARSEAIKRGVIIKVTATDSTADTNEWGPGWSVLDNTDTTLRVFPALSGSSTLNSTNDVDEFEYLASGRINGNIDDTLAMCDDRTGETGRQISISSTGRVSTTPVACP